MKLDLGQSVNVRRYDLWDNLGDKLWANLRDNQWNDLRFSLRDRLGISLRLSLRGTLWDSLVSRPEERG